MEEYDNLAYKTRIMRVLSHDYQSALKKVMNSFSMLKMACTRAFHSVTRRQVTKIN